MCGNHPFKCFGDEGEVGDGPVMKDSWVSTRIGVMAALRVGGTDPVEGAACGVHRGNLVRQALTRGGQDRADRWWFWLYAVPRWCR